MELGLQTGIGTHQIVWPHQNGLAGIPHTGDIGHDLIDLFLRELQDQHTNTLTTTDNRRGDKVDQCSTCRQIACRINLHKLIILFQRHRLLIDLANCTLCKRSLTQRGGKVDRLVDRVDHITTLTIDQIEVTEAKILLELSHIPMKHQMDIIVGAAVFTAIHQVLFPHRIWIITDVAGLHHTPLITQLLE